MSLSMTVILTTSCTTAIALEFTIEKIILNYLKPIRFGKKSHLRIKVTNYQF